jgi:ribosomal protein S18 acetylase RimI-like enzyme
MLVRAFDGDPVINWFVRQDGRRGRAIETLFRVALTHQSLPHGEVLADDDLRAAALWVPPDHWRLGPLEQLRLLPLMPRIVGWRGLRRALRGMQALDRAHPEPPHFYLLFLGVDPEQQGRGRGSALLRPVLERCDREGWGAYLENSKPRNTPFYRRHGFEITGEIDLGPGAPRQWAMWRDPRPFEVDLSRPSVDDGAHGGT